MKGTTLRSEFRITTETATIEVSGSEEFLRAHLEFLAPFVRRAAGAVPGAQAAEPAAAAPGPPGIEGVAHWWYASVPEGASPSIQDTMLIFAFYMRTYRKTVFVSEDIRRCFHVMGRSSGMEEPKSLLQILGNLRREHGLLLNAGRRGEYMMNTTGIARARDLLGIARGAAAPQAPASAPITFDPAGPRKIPDGRNIFKD